jgi:ribosomal protein L13
VTRTFSPKPEDVQRDWVIIDATDIVLGRLATHAAVLLRGKHKPTFAPHMDMGDFVIIINAEKVALTGAKLAQKRAYRHSGYPGGLSSMTYIEMLEKHPTRGREGRSRHAAEELDRSCAAHQAQGLRRLRAPARCAAAQDLHPRPGRAVARTSKT